MHLTLSTQPPHVIDADAVVIGYYPKESSNAYFDALNRVMQGALQRLVDAQEITGKHGEIVKVLAPAGVQTPRLLVLGLGDRSKLDRGGAFRAAAAAAKSLGSKPRKTVAYYVAEGWSEALVEAGICGAMVGCVGQDLYRAERKLHPFNELIWAGAGAPSIHNAWILAEAVNLARRLVNEPPAEIYPDSFAKEAQTVANEVGLECDIWDEQRLENEHCRSMLAVAHGSSRAPRLVVLRHRGDLSGSDRSSAPLLTFVGKGVTFDSGGLSIKDSENMKTMKCDMAGAATVLAAMQAIARLKLPIPVLGLCGMVENMVSGDSYKLGDVLRARSGKTIEVLNTDAEGRLVLADVLNVALELGAGRIIDLATLTGSCVVALGRDVAGAMTNDQAWCDQVLAAARECGEPLWQLPMFPEYAEQIKSDVADIKNIGDGRWGGAITAAKFLEEFVDGKPWVHLDIAGPAFLDSSKPWLDAGGTGMFVRTLVEIARIAS